MPTPFCKSDKQPQNNGQLCICDFCSFLYSEKCPKVNDKDPCTNCRGPISDCDKFDDCVWESYSKAIEETMKNQNP